MRRIGNSDLEVAPLALGGNVFGWTADESTSFAVLDAFTGGGGDLIDTADGYSAWVPGNHGGDSETIIGRWLARSGRRDDVTVVTKVSQHPDFRGLSAENIKSAAEASLQRLGIDAIDLYYAHFDDEDAPLAETLAAFDALITEGKIRYYGLSNYSPERIEEAFATAHELGVRLPVALQPHYNLLERTTFEQDYAPIAAREDLGVLPYYGLASGFLTGKYGREEQASGARSRSVQKYLTDRGFAVVGALQEIATAHAVAPAAVALAWLAAQPTITAPIASASTPEQVPDLLASLTVGLTEDELATLDDVSG